MGCKGRESRVFHQLDISLPTAPGSLVSPESRVGSSRLHVDLEERAGRGAWRSRSLRSDSRAPAGLGDTGTRGSCCWSPRTWAGGLQTDQRPRKTQVTQEYLGPADPARGLHISKVEPGTGGEPVTRDLQTFPL